LIEEKVGAKNNQCQANYYFSSTQVMETRARKKERRKLNKEFLMAFVWLGHYRLHQNNKRLSFRSTFFNWFRC
jgi:hypothetical protein